MIRNEINAWPAVMYEIFGPEGIGKISQTLQEHGIRSEELEIIMNTLFNIWNSIQYKLFPWLEEELDPLTEKEQIFVQVVSLMDLKTHTKDYNWCGIGRKRDDRANLAKAFIAKAVYNFETSKILIEYLKGCKNLRRLCGWENKFEIPS